MEGYFLTDRGQVRKHNEDAGGLYYNADHQVLAVIADGMGGHQAGDVASQLANDLIKEKWQQLSLLKSQKEAEEWLSLCIGEINKSIYDHSLRNKECEGMGTTIVLSICSQKFLTVAHVGDSRGYLLHNNSFKQITEDHSLVNELVRSGQISQKDAEQHPRKNIIIKAMGTEADVQEDILSVEWKEGDRLLLCSDGLSDKLNEQELAAFLQNNEGLKESGQEMIRLANERGGEDNISLILLEHNSLQKAGENE